MVQNSRRKGQACQGVSFRGHTLNSVYNEVAFNEQLAITKENLCIENFPFTYKYVALNEKPPITKENLHIFFFIIGGVQ